MSYINVIVNPPKTVDVIINPPKIFDVVTSPFNISSAVTQNEVLQAIGEATISGLFNISGAGAVTITSTGNTLIVSAPLSTGAVQTGSLTGVFYPLSQNPANYITGNGIINLKTNLNSGVNQQVITYNHILSNQPSSIVCSFQNDIDNYSYYYSISSVNISGFTVNFSDYLNNSGYILNSTINI